jgi:DNA-binding MarR family transcriptional regulator
LEAETTLNIVRTADHLGLLLAGLLKPYALSGTQYNVLRILRGAGAEGASCKEIAGRLVTRDPDVTRLMDRLEKRGLLSRDRAKEDRRVVTHRLTQAGLELVNELDRPIEELHQKAMQHMKPKKLRELIGLLEELRA